MNAQPQDHASMPFWDFMRSLDPEQAPGHGVDFNAAPNGGFPGAFPGAFPGDLPFRGPGPHARGHHGHHGPHGAGFEWGPWGPAGPWGGRRGGHGGGRGGGRFRRRGMNPGESEDDGFVSASDVENDAEKETQKEKEGSPNTMRDVDDEVPDPEEVTLTPDEEERPRRRCGGRGRFGGRGGPGGRGGRGGFGGRGRGGPHGGRFGPRGHGHGHFHGHGHGFGFGPFPGPHGPPPPPGPGGPFDFGGFMRGWAGHPFFRNLREQFQNAQPTDDDDSFAPPVDIFNTESAFILHVALPGAKKEDIGVNWDADSSILNIAGVIYRPGDEEFLSTLTSAERKVGMFERNVTLPPQGAERDEVDGLSISAKMVDGILIVTVPKIEKEWTEIHKVDIQ